MIEQLKNLIKENDLEGFKEFFKPTVNAHHRFLLAELAYRNQSFDIFNYMKERVSITKDNRLTFLGKLVIDGNKIQDFNIFNEFSDMDLHPIINANISSFINKNDENKIVDFFTTRPVLSYLNINKILYCGLNYQKDNLLNHFLKEQLESETIFYFGLCSNKFNCKDKFQKLISSALNYNGEVVRELTQIKFKHLKKIRGYNFEERRDEFNSFITESTINAFAEHLDSVLQKKQEGSFENKKKFKI